MNGCNNMKYKISDFNGTFIDEHGVEVVIKNSNLSLNMFGYKTKYKVQIINENENYYIKPINVYSFGDMTPLYIENKDLLTSQDMVLDSDYSYKHIFKRK